MLSPEEVYRELVERGCALRPGASAAEITTLEGVVGAALTPFAKEIYTRFDGFAENTPDNQSQMHIWSIGEIVRFKTDMKMISGITPFGDRLIHSDFMSCNLSTTDSPVILLESGEKLAESYAAFWFKLLNSEYDGTDKLMASGRD